MSDEKKVVEMPEQKMETTKRELSAEAREFINNATISIIKDVLPNKESYGQCLCSIGVNFNEESKEFDVAMINIFDTPQSTTSFVPVLQIIVDLATQKVVGQNNFVSPVVLRKNEHGDEVGAVLLGRNGDIDILGANVVAQIMANVHDDDEAPAPAKEEDMEVVDAVDAAPVDSDK